MDSSSSTDARQSRVRRTTSKEVNSRMTNHRLDRTGTTLTSDDRFAILEVLYTYCELLDAFEFKQMAHKVFTEDSRENHGYGLDTVHGRAQIAQLFTRLMSPYEGSMHNLSNVRFTQRSD